MKTLSFGPSWLSLWVSAYSYEACRLGMCCLLGAVHHAESRQKTYHSRRGNIFKEARHQRGEI